MLRWARLGWILVGLLAVFGAIHAPLHADAAPCSPAALCSGGVILLAAAAVVLALVLGQISSDTPRLAPVQRRHPSFLVERGRAPPRN